MKRASHRPGAEEEVALAAILGSRGSLQQALPEFEERPAQLRMAQAVAQAIANGEILLAEAGSGTGKTLAYLTPALLSGRKAVVATGTKTLQDQLFFKDVPLLASVLPRRFSASLMKGRANYLCRRNLRRALAETHTRSERTSLLKIQAWSATSERGDRAELPFLPDPDPFWDDLAAWSESCLGTSCEDYDACFLTRMRQEAVAADVLILNEAHLLEDVATDFFGVETSNVRIERLIRDAQREGTSAGAAGDRTIPAHLSRLAEASARFFGGLELPQGTHRIRPEDLDGIHRTLGLDLSQALNLLHDLIQGLAGKPEGLLACARRAREQAQILRGLLGGEDPEESGSGGPPVVRWSERRGRAFFLRVSP